MNDETITEMRARIAAEAEAAERDDPDNDELPTHIEVSRPGRVRSRVLQVRLNPDEYEAIERIAAERDLPPSTIARERLLQMIRASEEDEDASQLLAKLHAITDQIGAHWAAKGYSPVK